MRLLFICGGRGTRLGAHKAPGPKALVPVRGEPIVSHLWRALAPLHDDPRPPIFVAAAGDERVPAFVREHAPTATVLVQAAPDGVAAAMLLAREHLDGPVLAVLGDVLLRGRFDVPLPEGPAIGIWREGPAAATRANFGARLERDTITALLEKPEETADLACGLGAYVLTPGVLDAFASAPRNPRTGELEVTEALRHAIARGHRFAPLWFSGRYLNVNEPADLALAEELVA